MEPQNTWARAEEAFDAALQQPTAHRDAFVRAQFAHEPDIRDEVLRLLSARARMDDFLQTGVLQFRGRRFGAFVADEELARGGMSVVHAGHRVDGGFEQKVAIKIELTPGGIAPEAQILATFVHPHIARLFDAGLTETGFRYLVMEYVEGVPCTAYAGAASEREKLKLFTQICHAVQAAHRALVVHRDLKPANILITAGGTPKLLDFGISQVLADDGPRSRGPQAWTRQYASPEQMQGHPASTSNDIYSLGVILCEWIGGRRPDASLPLTGDLEAIARRALDEDPAKRYDSAAALARDIERYLAGEPVAARPASWRYTAGKFVSRYRYAVALTALAVAALAGTGVYAMWQARLAESRFNEVRSLSRSVMFELHDSVAPLNGSEKARQMIVERSLKYLDALAQDQALPEDVSLEAARGYLRIAETQRALGGPVSAQVPAQTAGKAVALAARFDTAEARAVRDAARRFTP